MSQFLYLILLFHRRIVVIHLHAAMVVAGGYFSSFGIHHAGPAGELCRRVDLEDAMGGDLLAGAEA